MAQRTNDLVPWEPKNILPPTEQNEPNKLSNFVRVLVHSEVKVEKTVNEWNRTTGRRHRSRGTALRRPSDLHGVLMLRDVCLTNVKALRLTVIDDFLLDPRAALNCAERADGHWRRMKNHKLAGGDSALSLRTATASTTLFEGNSLLLLRRLPRCKRRCFLGSARSGRRVVVPEVDHAGAHRLPRMWLTRIFVCKSNSRESANKIYALHGCLQLREIFYVNKTSRQ